MPKGFVTVKKEKFRIYILFNKTNLNKREL